MKLLLLLVAIAAVDATWRRGEEHIVPEKVYNYLDEHNWGQYHVVFHASRKWYLLGEGGRNWLRSLDDHGAQLQEGDPENGIEFLTMHRAMINHLSKRWGSEKVHNDPGGRKTFAEVLVGWETDADVIKALKEWGGDYRRFEAGLKITNDFDAFATEDEFGNYLQTTLKLSGQVDPNDSAKRFYDRDTRAGAGAHNWLHGQFMKRGSPISVGDPETNLKNIMFWRIHGWIENKWKEFEKHHKRTRHETRLFEKHLMRFNLHMQLHSDFPSRFKPEEIPSPPKPIANDMQRVIFHNNVDCRRLTDGTRSDKCPEGNRTPPFRSSIAPRVEVSSSAAPRVEETEAPSKAPWWSSWLRRRK